MWLRFGIASVLLLYVLVSAASISSREDTTEDGTKSKLPLVVSVPSKVSRANKMNANDIFVSSSFHGRNKLMTHSFPAESSTPERTAATTESTTTSSTTTTTTTKEAPEVTTTTTTTKEAPEVTTTTTTTTTEKPSSPSEESAHGVHEHDAASEEHTEPSSTSTTEGTTTTSTTSTITDEGHETTVILTTTPSEAEDVTNATSTKPSEEAVERDYGHSVEHQHEEESAVEVSSANDEGGHTVDLDSPAGAEESVSDLLEEGQGTNAEERVGVEESFGVEERVDTDIAEEVDPMDEAAQASEVDYAVLAPDISAVQQPEFLEHRPVEWDSEAVAEEHGTKVQDVPSEVKNETHFNDTDVKTSSTFSVAVLHPLGSFDLPDKPQDVAIPMERGSFKSDNASSATVLLPAPGSNSTGDVSEGVVVVLLDDDSTTSVPKTSPADEVTSAAANDSVASAKPSAKSSRASKKFSRPTEADNKDLEPAESSHDSPFILDPERAEEGINVDEMAALSSNPEAGLADEPSLLDSEVSASHADPENINEEGEYEYVYEYIDVNATDAPVVIPEDVLLVSDERPATPAQLPVQQPLPADSVSQLTDGADNSTQARIAPDGSRPPSFRNFGPADAADPSLVPNIPANETVPEAGPVNFQPLGVNQPAPVQAIPPIADGLPAALFPEEGSVPFIPGLPDSPVYFVGLQREKLLPGEALPAGPIGSKDAVSGHDSNALLDGKLDKDSGKVKGDEEQLNALYALSRALPLDDNLPFLISTEGDANATVFLPANLPDPFSDELLGDARKPEPVFTTTAASLSPISEELTTTQATTTTTTTTELPTTTTTAAITEAAATPAAEEKPVSKPPKRGSRPGGRRRPSTTTTVASTSAETTAATASVPARRGSRPSRVGGRRKTTAAAHGEADATTHAADTTAAAEATEKPAGADRSRFGNRGRGRLASQTTTKTAVTEEASTAAPSKDKESNTIANGGSRRPLNSRRNNRVSADASSTTGEKDTTSTRASGPARGGRRPQLTRNAGKNGDGKTTAAPASSDGDAEATTTTKKASIFRPRGRGRFQPKNKVGAAQDQPEAPEQSADETHATAESAASERKEESPVAGVPKVESAPESESTTAAQDSEAGSTESPATESSGPPRKFPPRFRPGARAAIPHRSTEASK